ncbi:MAG: DUF4864 domain-containing protein [Salinarimonadaceae bacterium]|nr:MAG: DUF4864 domain-containing protein [Salinarimonadaceae bacterium]
MKAFRTIFAALAAFALLALQPAQAQGAADRAEIAAAISGQLDAFRADDASRAYGFAAPVIQRMFPDEGSFMAMVRQGYPPVYRARSHSFGELRPEGSGFAQEVFIRDGTGEEWIAVYSLERQEDGRWLISGCRLTRRPGLSV